MFCPIFQKYGPIIPKLCPTTQLAAQFHEKLGFPQQIPHFAFKTQKWEFPKFLKLNFLKSAGGHDWMRPDERSELSDVSNSFFCFLTTSLTQCSLVCLLAVKIFLEANSLSEQCSAASPALKLSDSDF